MSTRTCLRRTRARAVRLPVEVHASGVPRGAVQERDLVHRREAGFDTALTCALLPGAVHGSLASTVKEEQVLRMCRLEPPRRGARRHYQWRHWSAGTISASTSDAFSRRTFPPTT